MLAKAKIQLGFGPTAPLGRGNWAGTDPGGLNRLGLGEFTDHRQGLVHGTLYEPAAQAKESLGHGEQYSSLPGHRAPVQDACLARFTTNAPSNSALCNCVARAIVPGKELAVHGPPNPPGPTTGRCPVNSKPARSPEIPGNQPRTDPSSQNQQLGKVLPLRSPAPEDRSAPCPPHRHVRATRQSPQILPGTRGGR